MTTFVSDANEYLSPIGYAMPTIHTAGEFALSFVDFTPRARSEKPYSKMTSRCFEASPRNRGNRDTAYLGQRLFLTNLQQSYGVRGSGVFRISYSRQRIFLA